MMGKTAKSTRQGFTLIELIATMVLVGVAAAIAAAGILSFSRIGEGENYLKNAQLAQQRMELILAQKRTTSDFENLDPCEGLSGEDFCDDVTVISFKAYDENNIWLNEDNTTKCDFENVLYCVLHIESGGQNYYMRLYHYLKFPINL